MDKPTLDPEDSGGGTPAAATRVRDPGCRDSGAAAPGRQSARSTRRPRSTPPPKPATQTAGACAASTDAPEPPETVEINEGSMHSEQKIPAGLEDAATASEGGGEGVEAGIVALWRAFGGQRDQQLRDRLVLHYAPLVKYVAGRLGTGLPAHVEVSDLIQSGIFGLVDAIEKFEPERGLKFETYAMQRIRGAILDDLRAQDWVPRSIRSRARDLERAEERLEAKLQRSATEAELAVELELSPSDLRDLLAQLQMTSVMALDDIIGAGREAGSLAENLPDQAAEDPVAALVDRDSRRQVVEAVERLEDRDRIVVTLYYFENLTLAEIGRVLGVTESRVCQLHTRAVLRLRNKLTELS